MLVFALSVAFLFKTLKQPLCVYPLRSKVQTQGWPKTQPERTWRDENIFFFYVYFRFSTGRKVSCRKVIDCAVFIATDEQ